MGNFKFQQIAGEVSEMDDVLHAFLAEDGAQAAEVTEFVGIAWNCGKFQTD